MPPRQCDTMSSTGRSRQKQNGGTAANRACVGVKLCCSFEISPRLTHSERQRQREKHLWIRALSTVTFVTAVCQLCSLSEWLTTHSQARPSTAVIIITLPLFWLLNDSIKHIYETVWKWLLLKEVSSPFQSMRAVLRSSVLGTSIWSAPSKWQIKPHKPILFTDFLTAVVAPLYSCFVAMWSCHHFKKRWNTWRWGSSWSWLWICQTECCFVHWVGFDGCLTWVCEEKLIWLLVP